MKNKFNFVFIAIIFALIFVTYDVHAISYGRVTNPTAITKTGPGISYASGPTLKYNDLVPLWDSVPIKNNTGCNAGWVLADVNGRNLYMCGSDVSTSLATMRTKSSVNMRVGPGTGYNLYESLPANKTLTLENTTKYSGAGCYEGWYRMHYRGTSARYVCSAYLTAYNTVPNAIVSNAHGAAVVNTASVNGTMATVLKYGQAVTLFDTTKYKGVGCGANWYKVWYNNSIKYVCSSNVVRSNAINVVNDLEGVNVRTTPSSSSALVIKLNYGDKAMLTSYTKFTGAGCSAGWYRINVYNKNVYICSSYITNTTVTAPAKEGAVVRKAANNTSEQIATYNKNQMIILSNKTKITGAGCNAGWYKVHVNATTGYVCSDQVDLVNSTAATSTTTTTTTTTSGKVTHSYNTKNGKYYTTNLWNYRLREDYAYVRTGPGTGYNIQNTAYLGTEFEVLGTSSGAGCSAGWYKVKYFGNKIGYICKTYVEKYTDVTKNDTAYCNTLKSAGFPASYCPFLSYLHYKHPNWVFKAENTNAKFIDAVNGESLKNYTQNGISAYWQSSTIRETPSWRTASDAYVAYMIDPRNYLNEQNIFAFEYLAYDSTHHTKPIVRAMVSGSYLDTDTYAGYFLDAARTYNVSPVHLAARVKQEGGTDSSYAAVSGNVGGSCSLTAYVCSAYTNMTSSTTGTLTDYVNVRNGAGIGNTILTEGQKGESFTLQSTTKFTGSGCAAGWYKVKLTRAYKNIYNYYNIGAYGSNPVMRGLQAAAGCVDVNPGTPWNSRAKAIKYGANFIADGYISQGQYTMFYQKFNVSPNTPFGKYTNQYMTNILAPASESLSTHDSYVSQNVINNGYVFKIPVYNNMPTEFTAHPPVS